MKSIDLEILPTYNIPNNLTKLLLLIYRTVIQINVSNKITMLITIILKWNSSLHSNNSFSLNIHYIKNYYFNKNCFSHFLACSIVYIHKLYYVVRTKFDTDVILYRSDYGRRIQQYSIMNASWKENIVASLSFVSSVTTFCNIDG